MKQSLQKLISEHVMRNGTRGLQRLSLDSGISVPTIYQVRSGHVPKWENCKTLAIQLGLSEEAAIKLADSYYVSGSRRLRAG